MSHAVHSMELCRIEILTTSYSLQSVLRIARLSQRVISCVTLSEQPLDTSEKDGATERDNNVRCVSLISISLMQSGRNRSRLINTCNYVSYDDRLFSAKKGDDVFLFVSQGNGHDQNNLVRVSKQKKTKGEKMHVCASPTVMSSRLMCVCLSYLCLFSPSLSSRERGEECMLHTNIAFTFTFIDID